MEYRINIISRSIVDIYDNEGNVLAGEKDLDVFAELTIISKTFDLYKLELTEPVVLFDFNPTAVEELVRILTEQIIGSKLE